MEKKLLSNSKTGNIWFLCMHACSSKEHME